MQDKNKAASISASSSPNEAAAKVRVNELSVQSETSSLESGGEFHAENQFAQHCSDDNEQSDKCVGVKDYLIFEANSKDKHLHQQNVPPQTQEEVIDYEMMQTECDEHPHFSYVYLDEVFELNVDEVFQLMFANKHGFFANFMSTRSDHLEEKPWMVRERSPGKTEQERFINYVVKLSSRLGPASANVTEKQIMRSCSTPHWRYVIDSIVFHHTSFQYSKSFNTIKRHYLIRQDANKCLLKVSAKIQYNESISLFLRKIIENSARGELMLFYKELKSSLTRESIISVQNDTHEYPEDSLSQPASHSSNEPQVAFELKSSPIYSDPPNTPTVDSWLISKLHLNKFSAFCRNRSVHIFGKDHTNQFAEMFHRSVENLMSFVNSNPLLFSLLLFISLVINVKYLLGKLTQTSSTCLTSVRSATPTPNYTPSICITGWLNHLNRLSQQHHRELMMQRDFFTNLTSHFFSKKN